MKNMIRDDYGRGKSSYLFNERPYRVHDITLTRVLERDVLDKWQQLGVEHGQGLRLIETLQRMSDLTVCTIES